MEGFVGALITGVVIIVVAFGVLILIRKKIKKGTEESSKPPELVEAEMQELIAKAKADLEREKGGADSATASYGGAQNDRAGGAQDDMGMNNEGQDE